MDDTYLLRLPSNFFFWPTHQTTALKAMCGIVAWFAIHGTLSVPPTGHRIQHRGPDASYAQKPAPYAHLEFHRLAINGIANGEQPFITYPWSVVVNGEIYNTHALQSKHRLRMYTDSDCEVISHLMSKTTPVQTFSNLDGVYACVCAHLEKKVVVVSRDPFGVRSLYIGRNAATIGIASEAKVLHDVCSTVIPFPPGETWIIDLNKVHAARSDIFRCRTRCISKIRHHIGFEMPGLYPASRKHTKAEQMVRIRELLARGVEKRMMIERKPIGAFLSGGLDSSLIAALLVQHVDDPAEIQTFSIGLEGSPDILAARVVAKFLHTTHHEVIVTEQAMLDAIPRTVAQLETWDTTTIRAGTPMLMLSEYIRDNTDVKVVFSGEGSDELSGSYIYMRHAPSPEAFHEECLRLCKDLHYFDVLRADKCTSYAGLEVRVPFLDVEFAKHYLRVPPEWRQPQEGVEKHFLRTAFDGILPDEILWRTKEAFSDGVSSTASSWHTIIQRHVDRFDSTERPLHEKEAAWLLAMFLEHYPRRQAWIPYQWLPKFSGNVGDPSARVLEHY